MHQLQLPYKLQKCHINPTQYEKMHVCLAAQFFSQSTTSALKACVKLDLIPKDALTTAWFLRFVNKWSDAMNAHHKQGGLLRGDCAQRRTLESMLNQSVTYRFLIVKFGSRFRLASKCLRLLP